MIKKLSTVIATGALFATMALPALAADTTINITANGAGSDNTVVDKTSNTTTVNQTNVSDIVVGIDSHSSTGGNKSIGNTNGDSSITSGNATSTVGVSVTGGSNDATVPSCGCSTPTKLFTIANNGAGSSSEIISKSKKKLTTNQINLLSAGINIDSTAKTGHNKTIHNTNGSSAITSGDSTSTVGVNVDGPSNTLNPTPTP